MAMPTEPRPEGRTSLECLDVREESHERVLHVVQRFLLILKHAARHGEQPPPVGAHDRLVGTLVL
jgi:hypothetical protein